MAEDFQYITLREILAAALGRWKLFMAVAAAGMVLSFVFLAMADKQYEARVLITHPMATAGKTNTRSYSGLGSIASSLLGGGGGRMNFLDVMRSEELARALDEKHRMSLILFGSLWDKETEAWDMGKLPFTGKLRRALRRLVNMPVPETVTAWDTQKWLAQEITVVQAVDKSAWTLSLRHRNPQRALQILQLVMLETEQILVDRRQTQIAQQVAFYEQRLPQLNDRDLRLAAINSLSRLLQEGIALDSGVSYGAEIIYGPQVTDFPVSPGASMFILVGIFLSGIAAFLTATIAGLIKRPRQPQR